jgi:peptide chain release factor 3
MAAKKTIVEEAFPGDVSGLYDSGNFKIGGYQDNPAGKNFKNF